LDALLRDAPVAKRSNKANRQARGAGGCQRYGYGPSEKQTQAGYQESAGDEGREEGANSSPHGPAQFATLFCFAAQFSLDFTIITEVLFTGVIGHEHVDVPCVIAALNNGLVCALDTLAVFE
jgi:hypothetical protein